MGEYFIKLSLEPCIDSLHITNIDLLREPQFTVSKLQPKSCIMLYLVNCSGISKVLIFQNIKTIRISMGSV